MKVGIVGGGYVGQAMAAFFEKKHEVAIYDKDPNLCRSNIADSDLAVICVPTPTKEDGSCDTSIVEDVIDWVDSPLILIKSTVSIGTTDRLKEKTGKRIAFSPEYCGEGGYYAGNDFNFQNNVLREPFYIFGGDKKDTSFLVDIFVQIAGPSKTYMQTSAINAETTKYMENAFLMTKVVFCYEMFNVCKAVDADWNEVREAWLLDPRIGRSHSAVFADNIAPANTKCIPKDVTALVNTAKDKGYNTNLIKEVINSNNRIGKGRLK